MKYSVLVVDDDKYVNEFVTEAVKQAGYSVDSALSGKEALAKIRASGYHIVLSDIKMPEMDGITLLDHVKRTAPESMFVIMTAHGTVELAVQAFKKGAYDFLLKPITPEMVEQMLRRVSEVLDLRNENESLKENLEHKYMSMIGKSQAMKDVFELISSVAQAKSTIMVTGPSGSGKEMVARAIHYRSNRRSGPFVKLNCAALPENLVEAELFGYEKGAFTDAKKTHRGRFESADGGTLLLDEVSEMPLSLQPKLLRVLQEREFERIGSTEPIQVDVRVIATSNRNLQDFIARGQFREDLYYRLNVIPVKLPKLRDRKEDIPLLVDHFIARVAAENERTIKSISPGAMKMLIRYDWPGNVRELENMIERAVVTSRAEMLGEKDFPVELSIGQPEMSDEGLQIPMKLEEGSKYLILKTLERYNGNKTRAAEALGISARTIRNKLAEYESQNQEN